MTSSERYEWRNYGGDEYWGSGLDLNRLRDRPPLSPTRVQHPGMANQADIQPGVVIHCHYAGGSVAEYEVIDVGEDTFTARYTREDLRHITTEKYFSDSGMQPYPGGWNPTNYITIPEAGRG